MIRPAEIWKRIPGTLYEASSEGFIRRAVGGQGTRKGTILTAWKSGGRNGNGYYYVRLCENGQPRAELVHRLVALAFHGEPPHEGAVVDHVDADTSNNRPENIEWVTRKENFERCLVTNGGHYDPPWLEDPWKE